MSFRIVTPEEADLFWELGATIRFRTDLISVRDVVKTAHSRNGLIWAEWAKAVEKENPVIEVEIDA